MSKMAYTLAVILLLSHAIAGAKTVELNSENERRDDIRRADIWIQPSWISDDFQFAQNLDVLHGPKAEGPELALMKDHVACRQTPDDLKEFGSGHTPKFHCRLLQNGADGKPSDFVLDKHGEPFDLKVRYNPRNREIWGQVLGTRLLWALGFGADRFFCDPRNGLLRLHRRSFS